MIQSIAGERFNGDWKSAVIHKQSHLYDRKFSLFLAYTKLSLAFFYYVSLIIQNVIIRILDLKIKVCHIIIDEFWRPSGFFDQIGIDAPDDFVLVGSNTIQGIVNIVRIEPFIKNGFVIIAVLSYRGRFGSRIKESAKDKKFGKAIDIVFQFGKSLIGRKERIQPQFF